MTAWLKLVGATDNPMPDPWLLGRLDLHNEAHFTTRAGVEIGEELVLYAVPQRRVIGLAEVVSHPVHSGRDERWPWRSKTKLKLAIADYDRAPALDDLQSVGGRDLNKAVQRRSHMKLDWAELQAAKQALEKAFEASKGDLRA